MLKIKKMTDEAWKNFLKWAKEKGGSGDLCSLYIKSGKCLLYITKEGNLFFIFRAFCKDCKVLIAKKRSFEQLKFIIENLTGE